MHGFMPDPSQLLAMALVFLRISVILFALPIIGDPPTPILARILIAVALTAGIYPIVPSTFAPRLDADVVVIFSYVVREVLVGVVVGYIARIAFDCLLMASSIVGYQMGFGTASLFVPDAGQNMDAFTAFHRLIIMLIFLALDLHHIFIAAIVETFRVVPGGLGGMHGSLASTMITATASTFSIAIQLAAPILVALLFTMAGLGLVARTVPQMNVFTMSFPVSFFVGIMVYIATFPLFPDWMRDHFMNQKDVMMTAIRGLVN